MGANHSHQTCCNPREAVTWPVFQGPTVTMSKTAFATVGSTTFDPLVSTILSSPCLQALASQGFSHLVVQCGNSKLHTAERDLSMGDRWTWSVLGLKIDVWRYKPSLEEVVNSADLVISHAGWNSWTYGIYALDFINTAVQELGPSWTCCEPQSC